MNNNNAPVPNPPPPPPPDLNAELASLVRVRNRLAQTSLEDHGRFNHILTGLLPRLLRRLNDNTTALGAVAAAATSAATSNSSNNDDSIRSQMQTHLTAMLSHILERVRLLDSLLRNKNNNNNNQNGAVPSPQSWIESTAGVLPELTTSLAQTMALTLLQAGFTVRHLWWLLNPNNRKNHQATKEESPKSSSSNSSSATETATETATATCLQSLQRFQDVIFDKLVQLEPVHGAAVPQQQPRLARIRAQRRARMVQQQQQQQGQQQGQIAQPQEEAAQQAGPQQQGQRQLLEQQWNLTQSLYNMVGWLTLNELWWCRLLNRPNRFATLSKALPPGSPTALLLFRKQSAQQQVTARAAAASNSPTTGTIMIGPGTFHLWLDFLLYRPDQDYRGRTMPFAPNVGHCTGLSRLGLERLQNVPPHARAALTTSSSGSSLSSASQMLAQWRHYKVLVLQEALDKLPNNHTNGMEQALVLAIVCAQTETMHGKMALTWLEEYHNTISLPVTFALLNLVVGQIAADAVWQETMQANKQKQENTEEDGLSQLQQQQQQHYETQWQVEIGWDRLLGGIVGATAASSSLARLPLPQPVAARVVRYLQTHLSPHVLSSSSSTSTSFLQLPPALAPQLFARLVAAVRQIDVYWALQLAGPFILTQDKAKDDSSSMSDNNGSKSKEEDSWRKEFFEQGMEIAQAVLLAVPAATAPHETAAAAQAAAEALEELWEQGGGGGGVAQQPLVPVVQRPLGGGADRLLARHRVKQQEQQLHSFSAREAREIAYGIIAQCASNNHNQEVQPKDTTAAAAGKGENNNKMLFSSSSLSYSRWLELAKLLFQCAAFEQYEQLQKSVKRSLNVLLQGYQKVLSGIDKKEQREAILAPLLPCLLSTAATAEMPTKVALRAVVQWCETLLAPVDSAAALHICAFLGQDDIPGHGDEQVQRAARRVCRHDNSNGGGSGNHGNDNRHRHKKSKNNHDDNDNRPNSADPPVNTSNAKPHVTFLNPTVDPQARATIQSDLRCRAQQVQHISALPLSEEDALLLLAGNRFDKQAVAKELTQPDSAKQLLVSEGIIAASASPSEDDKMVLEEEDSSVRQQQQLEGQEDAGSLVLCEICFDESPRDETFALPQCNHRFCTSCYADYLQNNVSAAQPHLLATKMTCPHHECNIRIGPSVFESLNRSSLREAWDAAITTMLVDLDDQYRQCPGPNCSIIAMKKKKKREEEEPSSSSSSSLSFPITCTSCQTNYCFGCGEKPHEPATCVDTKAWERMVNESSFWVKKNSKPCPGCQSPIQKNKGCNHMKCTQCGADFCWVCLALLNSHLEPHTCNRYDPTSSMEDGGERRALFFADRYHAHDDAELFMLRQAAEFDGAELSSHWGRLGYMDEEELEMLRSCILSIAKSRRFLKHSYVARWAKQDNPEDETATTSFSGRSSHRDRILLFEAQQATLELVTERLSRLILTNLKQIQDKEGSRGLDRFFRVMMFQQSSIEKYMIRMSTTSSSLSS